VRGSQPFLSVDVKAKAFRSEWAKLLHPLLCHREMISLIGTCDTRERNGGEGGREGGREKGERRERGRETGEKGGRGERGEEKFVFIADVVERMLTFDVIEELFREKGEERRERGEREERREGGERERGRELWCWPLRWIMDILDILAFTEGEKHLMGERERREKEKEKEEKEGEREREERIARERDGKVWGGDEGREIRIHLQSLFFAHPREFGISADTAIIKV
jgi:hypothetical protein